MNNLEQLRDLKKKLESIRCRNIQDTITRGEVEQELGVIIASLEAEPVEGELLNYKAVEIGETMKSGDIVLQKET